MRNRPSYAINSVDSALLLATLLRIEGPLGVTDAAQRLGVAPSTAHRLLGMLVYRDFATQLPDRRYAAGPVWRDGPAAGDQVARLRDAALPHLRRLVAITNESANIMVLTGTDVRFLATVECHQALRVTDRTGRVLPAHLASGGKALLATMPPAALADILHHLDDRAAGRLRRELRTIRRDGYAVNNQDTERGLTAIGTALPPGNGPPAALSIAMPTARYARDQLPAYTTALTQTATAIAAELSPNTAPGPPDATPPAGADPSPGALAPR